MSTPSEQTTSDPPATGRLKLLCVGTGRDGTTSLAQMVSALYANDGRQAIHEYASREFYQLFCDYRETGDQRHLNAVLNLIAECPYDCIVGNGYAPILPLFAKHYGSALKIVHLRRADRGACVASLEQVCRFFPEAFKYYSNDSRAAIKRFASFHFNESDQQNWEALPLAAKLGWYYDKTHALIEAARPLFDTFEEIETEKLDDEVSRRRIAHLVLGRDDTLPPLTKTNQIFLDNRMIPPEIVTKAQVQLQHMNIYQVGTDDLYLLRYSLDVFLNWVNRQQAGAFAGEPGLQLSHHEIGTLIERGRQLLENGLTSLGAELGRWENSVGDSKTDNKGTPNG